MDRGFDANEMSANHMDAAFRNAASFFVGRRLCHSERGTDQSRRIVRRPSSMGELVMAHFRALLTGCIALCVVGCGGSPEFQSSIPGSDRTPWTHLDFHNRPENFQFAVIGDLAGGFRPEVFRKAVGQLNAVQPEFVMSVGDLIETWDWKEDARLNDRSRIEPLWAEFFDIVSDLEMPFFCVGGNNGLGNDLLEGMWRERFGHTHYSFSYGDVLFVVLSTDDPPGSSDGQMSEGQIDWLATTLAHRPDTRWTFLFLHRPLWLDNPSEWQPVEEVLGDRPRTIFAGHHHAYKVTSIDGFSYYSLATTGGVSSLSGPAGGGFDHLVWVTMTDDGPRIANLMQDGIWGDNPVAEAVGDFELTTVIRQRGVEAALVEYERLRREDPTRVMFNDEPMTELGYDLMSQGKLDAALQVLALNAETYQDSSGAHGALAEAYDRLGEREKALESCRTALELNPENAYAAELMERISSAESAASSGSGG
jgi:hypothetical protein